jgi:hypothetical protein
VNGKLLYSQHRNIFKGGYGLLFKDGQAEYCRLNDAVQQVVYDPDIYIL